MNIFLNKLMTEQNIYFFLSKLNCQRCGKCCQTPEGQILRHNEVEFLAEFVGLPKNQFKEKYTFTKDGERFLNSPCPFLGENGCNIYKDRPQVCRQFPFNQTVKINGVKWMTVTDCPAGKIIGEKYGVKL